MFGIIFQARINYEISTITLWFWIEENFNHFVLLEFRLMTSLVEFKYNCSRGVFP